MNCGRCSKIIIVILNVLLMICGLMLLSLGAWFLSDLDALKLLHISTLDTSNQVVHATAVAMVSIGSAVFVISVVGCVAAMRESKFLLSIYCGFNVVIMILEIVLCILVIVSIDDILYEVESTMSTTVQKQYGQEGYEQETDAWNTIQHSLHCCGANGTSDWLTSLWIRNETFRLVPDSCCPLDGVTQNTTLCQQAARIQNQSSPFIYWTGCEARTTEWVYDHRTTLVGISVSAAIFQLIIVVVSLSMYRNVKKNYSQL